MRLLGTGPGASRIPVILQHETPDESLCLKRAHDTLRLSAGEHEKIALQAAHWIQTLRQHPPSLNSVEGLLRHFPLHTSAGQALMRLGECYLRTPDSTTRAMLIAELLNPEHWKNTPNDTVHRWLNPLLTLISRIEQRATTPSKSRVTQFADPLIQTLIERSIQRTGNQFLLAKTLEKGQQRADQEHLVCSFDMLGEGARTQEDAEHYFQKYLHAAQHATPPHGLSIKLSALCPRFEDRQRHLHINQLVQKVCQLAETCLPKGVPLTLDAEENSRLLLTLEVLEQVSQATQHLPKGLGLAVQAYNRRSLAVIEHLISWATEHHRGLQIRLVKGAYWDSEIAHAQREGLPSFPVFTSKAATDLNYLACARKLLAHRDAIYPMFATHNAHTIAAILHWASPSPTKPNQSSSDWHTTFEFQRLYGMGDALWKLIRQTPQGHPLTCRVYAPIGQYDTALAYLIRRLLENGANSSFVHALFDEHTELANLTANPDKHCENHLFLPNPHITPASELFPTRKNSPGLSLTERETQLWLQNKLANTQLTNYPVTHPETLSSDILHRLFQECQQAGHAWAQQTVEHRAEIFEQWAELLIRYKDDLLALLVLEAGKTWTDALAEWREGLDFLYHYSQEGIRAFSTTEQLPGPAGELNQTRWHPRGVCMCISPWNFPMAIFIGQMACCLIGGNSTLVKAAPQTQRLTHLIVELAYQAGLPRGLIQNLGATQQSAQLALDTLPIQAVFFTGSNATSKKIAQTLANKPGPIIPFIAETGGVNCMIVDSTALLEQACDAILQSAFGSAGQRCSALRIVYVQEEISDTLKHMVQGTMQLLQVGDPTHIHTDIGPLIDETAWKRLQAGLTHFQSQPHFSATNTPTTPNSPLHWFAPTLIEQTFPGDFQEEWFGPLLQWVSFKQQDYHLVCEHIAQNGWGLTLGLQSRLPSRMQHIETLPIGNIYINRPMTGAVVGSQPFGGQGLSGTGPKSGGKLILYSAMVQRCISNNIASIGGVLELITQKSH